MEIWMRLNH